MQKLIQNSIQNYAKNFFKNPTLHLPSTFVSSLALYSVLLMASSTP